MTIKFEKSVCLSHDQMLELAALLETPDMGFDKDCDNKPIPLQHGQYYDVVSNGDHGTYEYRINLSYELITIKGVK